ncbi:1-acyl-sn-glycerol-3-phosphate acyltransferase [Brachybacterium endophyticum]|uniref:1-acyl-sn-glycerol-3-phosphate acyltransferase n=1 Tax=Brachybacterium endophyticum TaxID=2182385 RepID=A0A2U2RPX5_9MICO|nr:1-acyl-sn-glycerol-3-phosphate acyltransferase [Brachybacterium endophyticum]
MEADHRRPAHDPAPARPPHQLPAQLAAQQGALRPVAEQQTPSGADEEDGTSRSARLRQSLSSHLRSRGWDPLDEDTRKYRSRARSSLRFVLQRGLFRALVRANVTQTVQVARRVKSVRGPFVLVANHTSHLDAPLLAEGLPWAQARFLSTGVAADYWFRPWYKRLFVRLLFNAYPIDRDGSRKNSGFSRRLLRSGVPILVFPEGGRQKTGVMGEFKPGAAALASGVGIPIIPAALVGGYEAMPKGRSWPKPGRPPVGVVFGDPMMAHEGESVVDYMERVRAQVVDLYESTYEQILGPESGPREENR